jgi:hypothetical protein
MIIPDTVAAGAIGAAAAQTNIGNFVIAEWASNLMGIKPYMNPTAITTAEKSPCTWQLGSNEVKGFLPLDGPMQWTGTPIATNSSIEGFENPYFPINARPIYGGETVTLYITAELAITGNAQGGVTVWYGQEGDLMPAHLDPIPDRQRYYVSGAIGACAAGAARSAAIQFNVVGGEFLTELYGNCQGTTMGVSDPKGGVFELVSSGFASSPLTYYSGSSTPYIGTGMGNGMSPMAKVPCAMPIDRMTVIDSYFTGAHAAMLATDDWEVAVQFIRPGE